MAFGENRNAQELRLQNQRQQFPELGTADASTVFAVDRLRREEGRDPTSLGSAVEYSVSEPDTAPNVQPWKPSGGLLNSAMGGYGQSYDEGYQPPSPFEMLPAPTPGRFENAVVNAPGQAIERMGHVANYLPIGQENQQRLDSAISDLPYGAGDVLNSIPSFAVGGEGLGAARGIGGAIGSVAAPNLLNKFLPANTPDGLRTGLDIAASVAGGAAGMGLGGVAKSVASPQKAYAMTGAHPSEPSLPSGAATTAIEAAPKPPTDPLTALMTAVQDAKPLQEQNKELLSAFRSRQAGGFSGSVGSGESGFNSGLSAMRGTAERVGFEPLRDAIGQDGVDELFTRLGNANLRPFEHASAGSALRNIMDGVVPVPSELAQLEKAYPGLTKALQSAKIVSGPGIVDYAKDLIAVPQSLMSSLDLSGLRQTATAAYGHPKMFAANFMKSLDAAKSEGSFQAIQNDLDNRWYAPLRQESGITFQSGDRALTRGEGTIISDVVNKIPGYRPSQRAYSTLLNTMRDGLFQHMLEGFGDDASKIPADELRRWGRMINATTGRGDLKGLFGGVGEASTDSKIASQPIFWAPRLMMSRAQMPFELLSSSPQVRAEVARQLVSFVGVNSLLLGAAKASGAADVTLDPKSADFGQFRVGNQRLDPWFGFRPIANLTARLLSGQRTSTTTGDTSDADRKDIVADFLRQKFSPLTGAGANLWTGQDAIGQPYSAKDLPLDTLVPLFLKDLVSAAKNGYELGGIGGAAKGVALAAPGGVGVGVNSYEPDVAQQGYANMHGRPQLDAIPEATWQVLRDHPQMPEQLKALTQQYGSLNGWQRELRKAYEQQAIEAGYTKANASYIADQAVQNHPLSQMYSNVKNELERRWIADNPQEAERLLEEDLQKPWSERRFQANRQERQVIQEGSAPRSTRIRKTIERDANGRMTGIVEEHEPQAVG